MFKKPNKTTPVLMYKPLCATTMMMVLITASLLATLPTVSAVTTFQTNAFISLAPNPVGVGQNCHVRLFLSYFPPTANDYFHGFRYTITKPDGTTQTGGPYTSDPNGAYDFNFVPTSVGTYTFQFIYPGESFANGTLVFTASQAQATLTVQQAQIQQWPDAPLPTDYWTRPISAELRTWYSISGNWLQGGYDAAGRMYGDSAAFNPYTGGPRTPHVVWTKSAGMGGLIGGEYGSDSYYTGLQYDSKVTPPIIINGRLYYRLFHSSSGSAGRYPGFVCVDLRTGEELWRNMTGSIDFGQIYVSRGYNGQGGRAFLYQSSSTTWTVYDAWSGEAWWYLTSALASPSKVFYGPNGDVYTYHVTGTAATRRLIMWNSTRAWEQYGWFSGDTLRSDRPGSFNWLLGVQWNVTVPDLSADGFAAPSVLAADPTSKVIVLQATHTAAPNDGITVQIAYDALTGRQLWMKNRQFRGCLNTRFACGEGMLVMMNMGTLQRSGFDLRTGEEVWLSDPTDAPWGMYSSMGIVARDKVYAGAYDGYMRAFDINTGRQVWEYFIGNSGLETPYGTWPMFNGPTIGGYELFCGYSEHTPNTPLYRGAKTVALDTETGEELWSIDAWLSLRAVADGYLVTVNMYDQQIYVLGKGPTKLTVSTPQTAVKLGESILVSGTILDQSPALKDTPCIARESMADWMEYKFMQKPYPSDVKGVAVWLNATSPSGRTVNIVSDPSGYVLSDANGNFACMWTPDEVGVWTIKAVFPGTDAYGSSTASAYVGVAAPVPSAQPVAQPTLTPPSTVEPTATPTTHPSVVPQPEAPAPTIDVYIVVATIVVIMVVITTAMVFLRKHK